MNERSEQRSSICPRNKVNEQQRQPMPTTKVNVISTLYGKKDRWMLAKSRKGGERGER